MTSVASRRADERIAAFLPDSAVIRDVLPPGDPALYAAAIEHAAGALSATGGVALLVSFGPSSVPGVSDIDLLAVCEDEAYGAVVSAAAVAAAHPLFTHQIFVLPRSLAPLRPTLFFEQVFNPVATVFGDASLLAAPPTSREQRALSAALWGSALAADLPALHRPGVTIRDVLLAAQTLARQAALDALALGESARARGILAAAAIARRGALRAPDRQIAARRTLAATLVAWSTAEQAFDAWWRRQTGGPLPAHDHLAALVADVLPRRGAPPDHGAPAARAVLPPAFRKAADAYAVAARIACEWGERHAKDRMVLFLRPGNGIFPTPFNRCA